MAPLTQRKPIRTPAQIEASPHFAALKSASQKDWVKMLAGGSAPLAAVGSVFNFTSKESARQFMYDLFEKLKPVLRELYGETEREDFLRDVDRASKNPKTTPSQVRALFLFGVANGFVPSNFSLDDVIRVSDDPSDETGSDVEAAAEGETDYRQAKRKFETAFLKSRLEAHHWNVSKTAQEMGLERSALSVKLRNLGIKRPALVPVGDLQ